MVSEASRNFTTFSSPLRGRSTAVAEYQSHGDSSPGGLGSLSAGRWR
jgi:hypothetical protein